MSNHGFLAIWTDIEAEHFNEYRRWLSQEHMGQRIFAPGFLGARVHSAADNELSHFILYATKDKDVLQSESYIQVLNNPTKWTQQMMPRLRAFDRGAGEQIAKVGDGCGTWLLACRISETSNPVVGSLAKSLLRLLETEGIVTARLLAVDRRSTDVPTVEKTIRAGPEGAFRSLLVIEATSEAPLLAFEPHLRVLISAIAGADARYDARRYRSIYTLHPFEGATEARPTRNGIDGMS